MNSVMLLPIEGLKRSKAGKVTIVSKELSGNALTSERTRKIVIGIVFSLAALLALWWSFDSIQLWREQGRELSIKEAELIEIEGANQILQERRETLYQPSEIEWLARQNFGLIKPGEEAFIVPPPAPEPVRLPSIWPFTHLAEVLGG